MGKLNLLINILMIISLSNIYTYSQFVNKKNDINKSKEFKRPFIKSDVLQLNKSESTDFYPLYDGDFWEYIVTDTTVFMDFYEGLKYSVAKEIIGDTLMSNGFLYKILRWEKCGNSVNQPPTFEYQRKDSIGRVFTYYNNEDKLLYDFDKNIGDQYESQYAGYIWKILNIYTVTGFGNQYTAIDIGLYEQGSTIIRRTETLVEGFGLIYFSGDINLYSDVPEGNFFGGIINSTTYGDLLAKRQEIDWSEFYPLHIGDFWKYQGNDGFKNTFKTIEVIGDAILNDRIFKKLQTTDVNSGSSGITYERFEGNTVYKWQAYDSTIIVLYKFSTCLGDTFSGDFPDSYFRIDDKSISEIKFFLYPDLVYYQLYFEKGLGLTELTIQGGNDYLIGAVINGQVFGDTTITDINEEYDAPNNFVLFQNYPNPFNPTTNIKYRLSSAGTVNIKVVDVMGRIVATLINNKIVTTGEYEIKFNAAKHNISSGVYFLEINVLDNSNKRSQYQKVIKMLYLR